MKRRKCLYRETFICFLLILLYCAEVIAFESYEVQINCNGSSELKELLTSASQLIQLRDACPSTMAGLKNRAEADIENLLKVLHSQAYYNANIHISYETNQDVPKIFVQIDTGPIYPLASFAILVNRDLESYKNYSFPSDSLSADYIGIELGIPATPKTIIEGEETLLILLESWGYPLATIQKREVIADQASQKIFVTLFVDTGPQAFFGPTTIRGKGHTRQLFFEKKIAWCEGSCYDPEKINQTQMALEASGLFSSISISHADSLNADGLLPMEIEVIEGKHRSIGWGLTYNTQWGPGVTVEWENRNKYGGGEKLSLDADIWAESQEAHLAYIIPDYQCPRQDWLWLTEFQHEKTKGYTDIYFSLSSIIERQVNANTRYSYGGTYKWLHDFRSDTNGVYNLFKIPLSGRWSSANSILEPTSGSTLQLKMTPTFQILGRKFAYCITTFIGSHYFPLSEDHWWVLATKFTAGSILGPPRRIIPSSERFYEGSENTLRGYQYQTVSPLKDGKPIGGRSMLIYSAELRVRATESLGWVLFSDIGNVYSQIVPKFNYKLLKSVGFGFRYHTPVGPLRFDFAVPLDRRRHLDKRFQIYMSIGQAF